MEGSIQLHGCDPALINGDEPLMMGIDEAGRGPVLGPMVYGSAFCAVKDEARLRAMGFADSKTLTEAKREELWAGLREAGFIGWAIRVLHATEISEGMLRRHSPYNLNAMSHDAAIGLVRGVIEQGCNLRYLYVDTVGDPDHYRQKLERIFPTLEITVAKKADSIYPIVSAASICAKVPRDTLLREWRFEDPGMGSDRDWGCGYPGDKDTQRWLRANLNPIFGWPNIARFSWAPALEYLDKNPGTYGVAEVRWPEADGEAAAKLEAQRNQMAAFLGKSKRQKVERHALFEECRLEAVEAF